MFLGKVKLDSGQKLALPDAQKHVTKTMDEFRIEAYEMWLEIFEREIKVKYGDTKAYSEDKLFKLISPYGNVIPLSWLEINVLEEYMRDFIKQKEEHNIEQQHTKENSESISLTGKGFDNC